MNHEKELLRSLWVSSKQAVATCDVSPDTRCGTLS